MYPWRSARSAVRLIGHAAVWSEFFTQARVLTRVCLLGYPRSLSSLLGFQGTCGGARPSIRRYPSGGALQTHGDDQIRTGDPLLAKQVLSQLSYITKMGSLHLRSSRLAGSALDPASNARIARLASGGPGRLI